MDRRDFFKTAATAAVVQHGVQQGAQGAPADPARKATMHIGTQHSDKDDVLTVMSSLGVNHICSGEISPSLDAKWSVDGLSRLRDRVAKHGISLDMVPLPLPSAVIGKAPMASIMLGQSPERDREIEQVQQMLRNCAKAGIPAVKYNMSILGVVRIGRTPGRGESTYSTWNYQKAADKDQPYDGGSGERGRVLGANRLLSFESGPCGGGRKGAHGLPSARPRNAGTAGLSGRAYRSGQPRGAEEVRCDV